MPVLIERDADPADAVTGTDTVASAGTIVALDAVAETTVPVSRPVSAILSASAESTELSAGTGSTAGFDAIVPVDTDDPPTVRAVETAAEAETVESAPTATTVASTALIFLNLFIFLL